ncbi:MAG: DUF1992 domain-containing protein [Pseudomonadales bacterium]|jgi:hypothetical protein
MAGVDDIISEWIRKAERTGELKRGPYWGKPFDLDDGYDETPARLRMAYRILKNAGYVPAEVAQLNHLAELKERLTAASDAGERARLERAVAAQTARVRELLRAIQRD